MGSCEPTAGKVQLTTDNGQLTNQKAKVEMIIVNWELVKAPEISLEE